MIDEEKIINDAWQEFKIGLNEDLFDIIYPVFKNAYRVGYYRGHADSTTIRSKQDDHTN